MLQGQDSLHVSGNSSGTWSMKINPCIDIAIDVRNECERTLDHIISQFQTGNFKKEILVRVAVPPGDVHKEAFDPAL